MDAHERSYRPSGLMYGVAYYPEYHQRDRVAEDLDLMVAAGITVIRVGESVWSTWEPRDGEFDLEWLAPVLDAAHEHGIRVILGTPTYAVPPWLQVAHPEIAAERRSGEPIPWGARQEVDYSHPTFRFHAERVIRAILARYATHPSVIGFQVDNEPGLELFHNPGTFERFVAWLKAHYGDVETLNREWGLTYWSHLLGDWSELWRPDGNSFPQYDLAWRRFQAELTTDFIGWQAALVDEYRTADQFVTTCLQYPRPALDEEQLSRRLDVTSGNPYYGMQDHLDVAEERAALTEWTTTGVAGLFRQADRMFASKQARYLVTETNAQSIGTADMNYPPYPGQLKQAAFALISRGAAMIEYWHWHTLPYGTETYWGGVLPHSLRPGRVYREVSEIGAALSRIGTTLDGFEPDHDVAILWSTPSRYALQYMPPLRIDGAADPQSYERIVDAFHRGVIDSGRQARIVHTDQALDLGAAELARRCPVLVAAALYVATDAELAMLRDYVAAGGHLILGPRTAYADHEARARVAVAPPGLHEVAGAWYEEYANLDAEVPVIAAEGGGLDLPEAAAARWWIDGLVADGAEVLARYRHPRFGDFPAVTTHRSGAGRVTVVGCVPTPDLATAIVRWAAPEPVSATLVRDLAQPQTIASGTLPDGRRAWFVFNWGWGRHEIVPAAPTTDLTSGEQLAAGTPLTLDSWAVRGFVGDPAGESTSHTPIK